MPLQRRLPKFGFTNINRVEYKGINISTLQYLADKKSLTNIDIETLIEAGLINKNALCKNSWKRKSDFKLSVKAHAFSNKQKKLLKQYRQLLT